MKTLGRALSLIIVLFFQFHSSLSAQDKSFEEIAGSYLDANKETLNLTSEDIREIEVSDLYTSKHNGVTHVYLNQKHHNIEVNKAIFNINILQDGQVLNFGNRFVSGLKDKVNTTQPSTTPEQAIQKVIDHYELETTGEIRLVSKSPEGEYKFSPKGMALEPISVELVYEVIDSETVQLVWKVQYYQLDAEHAWSARIDAESGEFLIANDRVIHCSFKSSEGVCSNHNHDHDCVLKESSEEGTHETLFMGSSYNVYPVPVQAPSFGDREIVIDPENLNASPFGWHDTNGEIGPEYTITRGNNVHVYQDIFGTDMSLGDEPDGGEELIFDFPLDLSEGTPFGQVEPAITNLFYWGNMMHDLWYNYGFNEVSGNFQSNNYGNGGLDGDYINLEGLDGSGTNNANFFSGGDGSAGRIQMFLWTNETLPAPATFELLVNGPEAIEGQLMEMIPASFGGQITSPGITGSVVLVADGIGVSSDGCEELTNAAELEGKIALIDRGICLFVDKITRAQEAGAIGVIVCQNTDEPPFAMFADNAAEVIIPAVMISMADCEILKMNLGELEVTMEAPTLTIPDPGPMALDGSFDNGIIAHEYGHGISNRLTGGASNDCLTNSERPSEGWSDWFGLVITTNSGNTADERRGFGTYALDEPTDGTGLRSFPYSRDMDINPDTYGDIEGQASTHRIGSVWCAMIWDLYWDMIDEHSFDDDIFNGVGGNNMAMQLVVDGLKLQACNPTFIDSRDAILAADLANYDGANECLIWEAFARRGLGFSASEGGDEAFDLPPSCESISTNDLNDSEFMFNISPNPTNGIFDLKIENLANEMTAKITNIEGRTLLSKNIDPTVSTVEFDLSNFASGIYLIHMEYPGFSEVRKIVLN